MAQPHATRFQLCAHVPVRLGSHETNSYLFDHNITVDSESGQRTLHVAYNGGCCCAAVYFRDSHWVMDLTQSCTFDHEVLSVVFAAIAAAVRFTHGNHSWCYVVNGRVIAEHHRILYVISKSRRSSHRGNDRERTTDLVSGGMCAARFATRGDRARAGREFTQFVSSDMLADPSRMCGVCEESTRELPHPMMALLQALVRQAFLKTADLLAVCVNWPSAPSVNQGHNALVKEILVDSRHSMTIEDPVVHFWVFPFNPSSPFRRAE